LKINSEVKIISFEIVPLAIEWNEPLLLILFTEQEQAEIYSQQANSGKNNSPAKDRRIKKLEQELAAAHADALSISQEQEAFTEELQSAHEEVVSSNEELQTVNEELETSKEEIESANEELTTTNQELQTRNDLLNESYEYSNAIVSTMHEPMLVLGKDLRVKSANKAFYKKFGVTEEQTEGVLLYDLGNKQWDIPALRELLEDIIPKNSQFYNYEVKHTFLNIGEKIMSLNASRVIQKAHREQLILLIIADITEVRRLIVEKELREKELLKKEIANAKQKNKIRKSC
jgi:two-component system, chemotaxis family, CheB/CheR fusion protein